MSIRFRKTLVASAVALATITAPAALATSTDGYHTIQIIPIAVQTSSFTTSFYFHNPNASAVRVRVYYHPGVGTTTAGQVDCGLKTIAANNVNTYATLGALCPGIAGASNFGWLYTFEIEPQNLPYAVFTRVDNPQAQGFEIESFPAHTFTAANTHVLGLKRTSGTPGATTNCFIGALAEPTELLVSLWSSTGTQIGTTQSYTLAANEFRRLSDIFATVGAPAGNYANVRLEVAENQAGTEPGSITFCTVQNNTTFDADFRIAKAYGVQDAHAVRVLSRSGDIAGSFTTGTYPNSRNRHVVYFKHPDYVQCTVTRLGGAVTDLEMRLVGSNGSTVLAGGNNVQGFGEIYLGNKSSEGGTNTRYYIDVETAVAGSGEAYRIECESGSGATGLEAVQRGLPDFSP